VIASSALFVRPGCWVCRPLSTKEVLLAKDVSESSIKVIKCLSNSALQTLLPGKMLAAVLHSFGVRGGSFSSNSRGNLH